MQKITTFEEAIEFFGISSAVSSSTALKKELVALKAKRWFADKSIEDLTQAERALSILVDTYQAWALSEAEAKSKIEALLLKIDDLYEKLE